MPSDGRFGIHWDGACFVMKEEDTGCQRGVLATSLGLRSESKLF